MIPNETIAAISTGLSAGGIGIIRISGPEAVAVADRVFEGRSRLSSASSHTVHYGWIRWEGRLLDEVLVTVMKAPRTYTREDVVEINCHGGTVVLRTVLGAVLAAGARMAEPGEFTKRAFLAGRIDLSGAEAVMDMISADNRYAEQNAVRHLRGGLAQKVGEVRAKLLTETAWIESAMDDPEHFDIDEHYPILAKSIDEAERAMKALIDTAKDGQLLRDGISTVILGSPNVGKSTLMNALSGEETAIVTDIAGTTRDVLTTQISLRGIPIKLMDTAGIRDTENVIEQIGVKKALDCAKDADLVLYVVDSAVPLSDETKEHLAELSGRPMIILLNKTDLETCVGPEEISSCADAPVIAISAKEKKGIDLLAEYISDLFFEGEIGNEEQVYITNERHIEALREALLSLRYVREAMDDGLPEDLYTVDLMDAIGALGRITGESASEDLINEIFEKFCMGK